MPDDWGQSDAEVGAQSDWGQQDTAPSDWGAGDRVISSDMVAPGDTLSRFLGIPYKWGGTSCKGTDCSGFTQQAYRTVGIDLPRTARDQYKAKFGEAVADPSTLKPGDQLFFQGTQKGLGPGVASHTGIYLGSGKFIQASSAQGKVVISDMSGYPAQYLGAKRWPNAAQIVQQHAPVAPPIQPVSPSDVQNFKDRFFDTARTDANIPIATAYRLAEVPSDQRTADPQLIRMSPVAQTAILQKAHEIAQLKAGEVPPTGFEAIAASQKELGRVSRRRQLPEGGPVPITSALTPEQMQYLQGPGVIPALGRFAAGVVSDPDALAAMAFPPIGIPAGAVFGAQQAASGIQRAMSGDVPGGLTETGLGALGVLPVVHGMARFKGVKPGAVQEPETGAVLQRQPEEAGVAGGGRGGVEPVEQGPAPAGAGEAYVPPKGAAVPVTAGQPEGVSIVARHGDVPEREGYLGLSGKNPGLTPEGINQAQELGRQFKQQGVDRIIAADTARTEQSAQQAGQAANIKDVSVETDFTPWKRGDISGLKDTPDNRAVLRHYVENPDLVPPGGGESMNMFLRRFLPKYQAADAEPGKTAFVLNSSEIAAVKAWEAKGKPADFSIDPDTYMQAATGVKMGEIAGAPPDVGVTTPAAEPAAPADVGAPHPESPPSTIHTAMGGAPSAPSIVQRIAQAAKSVPMPDVAGAIARFKDAFSNLNVIRRSASPETMLAARAFAPDSVRSQVNTLIRSAVPAIQKALGPRRIEEFNEWMVENRLRGIRQRWTDLAGQAANADFSKQIPEELWQSLAHLEGTRDAYKNAGDQVQQAYITKGPQAAQQMMRDYFLNAARTTAQTGLSYRDPNWFASLSNDPNVQAALNVYKNTIEKAIQQSHARNEGVFTDALGPNGAYYPLVSLDENGTPIHAPSAATSPTFNKPQNIRNNFATGQSDYYDAGIDGLKDALFGMFRSSSKAVLMKNLANDGLLVPSKSGDPLGTMQVGMRKVPSMVVNGKEVPAVRVETSIPRQLVTDEKSVWLGAQSAWIPKSMASELRPFFPDWGKGGAEVPLLNALNKLTLAGPYEGVFHGSNLAGVLTSEVPVVGRSVLRKTIGNTPVTKIFNAVGEALQTSTKDAEALQDLHELAQLGNLPPRTFGVTGSRTLADLTGAEYTKNPISRGLFGERGFDPKSRLVMFRAAKEMNGIKGPLFDESGNLTVPASKALEIAEYVDRLGQYNDALQGWLVRSLKTSQVGPFATAASTMIQNGMRTWLGSLAGRTLPTAGAKNAVPLEIAKQLSGGATGLVSLWAIAHTALRGKPPWEDDRSRFLALTPDGTHYYGMGFFNPMVFRGATALGIRGAYDEYAKGGTGQQMALEAAKGPTNAALHMLTPGPAIPMATTAALGVAPYVSSLYDKRTGRMQAQLLPSAGAAEPFPHPTSTLLQANPLAKEVGGIMGYGPEVYKYKDSSALEGTLRILTELAFPRLEQPPYDPRAVSRERQAAMAIQRTARKAR